jgi:glucokinase
MGAQLGCERVRLINDFTAMARSVPALLPKDLIRIGPEVQGTNGAAVAVLGPGTGFGVSCLVGAGPYEAVLATEGGHIPFAPQSELEQDVLRTLAKQFGRVSVERILSGPGLVSLYQTLAEISGHTVYCEVPSDVTSAAASGDELASMTADMFCSILGAVAGDFTLAYGARGGVYIAGGIAPRLLDRLSAGRFRDCFEAKGRFKAYLSAVPTWVIMHPYAALLGAARTADA